MMMMGSQQHTTAECARENEIKIDLDESN